MLLLYFFNKAALNELHTHINTHTLSLSRWLPSAAAASVLRPINLDQLRTNSPQEMKTHNNVFLTLNAPPPRSAWKNTACLVTYLIATGHHLCFRFPLLVFQAQTRLISWLPLIRGHISEHSGVSYAACWER